MATEHLTLAGADHPPVDDDVADRVEEALEQAGRRGITPPAAARRARCTTAEAGAVLARLVAHQHATAAGSRRFPFPRQRRGS